MTNQYELIYEGKAKKVFSYGYEEKLIIELDVDEKLFDCDVDVADAVTISLPKGGDGTITNLLAINTKL